MAPKSPAPPERTGRFRRAQHPIRRFLARPVQVGATMIRASVSALDRAGPSLGRLSVIGIMGTGGAAVAFESLSRH